jgi:NDP-sugar pyrophosphorylase family protein
LRAGEKFVGYDGGDYYWSDIGTLEAYRQAQVDALSGKVRLNIPGERRGEGLWLDRYARVHPTACIRDAAAIGAGADVGPGVSLVGAVSIGEDCRVRPGAVVRRSILLEGAYVGEGARVEDCIIGPGYEVRPGEKISNEVLFRVAQGGVATGAERSSARGAA